MSDLFNFAERFEALANDMTRLRSLHYDLENENERLRNENNVLKKQLEETNSALFDLERKYDVSISELAKSEKTIKQANDEGESWKNLYYEETRTSAKYKAELDDMTKAYQESQVEIDRLVAQTEANTMNNYAFLG